MKTRLPLLSLVFATLCHADTLRISLVAGTAEDDTERFAYQIEDKEEVVFVRKKTIISDADVQSAQRDVTSPGKLLVKLNPDGAKKMVEATSEMIPGLDRLAVIVNGRLVSAPVLNMVPMGADFMISGLTDLDERGIEELARKMSNGKVAPAETRAMPPHLKTVPYTKEEYQALKSEREKTGIFYVDAIPSEAELDKVLRKGMTKDEVLKVLGHASSGRRTMQGNQEDDFTWTYSIAPEMRPAPPVKQAVPDCFEVEFRAGKVSSWRHNGFGTGARREKLLNKSPTTLKISPPKVDLVNEEFDPKRMIEETTIQTSHAKPTRQDLFNVIHIASLAMNPIAGKPNEGLNANCDVLKFLALCIPEVAELKQDSRDGRIPADALNQALAPYRDGSKELPIPESKPDSGDGKQPAASQN